MKRIELHRFGAYCCSICLLLTISNDGSAQVQLATFTVAKKARVPITQVAFSPDGKLLAALVGGRMKEEERYDHVRIWDVKTRKEQKRLPLAGTSATALLLFTRDGKHLITSSTKGADASPYVEVWDLKKWKVRRTIRPPAWCGFWGVLSPDDKTLALAQGSSILLYDITDGKKVATLKCGDRVSSFAISKNGLYLAAALNDGKLELWELPKRKRLRSFQVGRLSGLLVAFSPDEQSLVVNSPESCLTVWSCKGVKGASLNFREVKGDDPILGVGLLTKALAWNAKTNEVVAAGHGSGFGFFLWNPKTKKLRGSLSSTKVMQTQLYHLALSPNGEMMAVANYEIQLWDIRLTKKGK